ncbi:MAG: hypothetical protein ABIJ47_06950 [Candidatus Bathyarchaeota archaeon]
MKARRLTGIMVYVPRAFLERFDESILGLYPTRSEAVRRGMSLILKEIQGYEKPKREAEPGSILNPCGDVGSASRQACEAVPLGEGTASSWRAAP